LFYRILGSNQDQLNKERQEELAAKLRHDQCLHGLAALEREFDELNGRMAGFTTLDAQYEAALKEKETLLVGKGTAETRQLLALAEKTGAVQAKQMELAEAILAGEGVKRSLTQVLECLSSASTWGTWDALGGGLTATRLKYSRIDDARRHAHEAQAHAARFERELSDIRLDVDLAFSSFTRFADYFLDNLISDWVIHAKIEKSRSSAQLALTNIEQALLRLRLRVEEGKRELTEAMAERQSIIERA
jgi:hypothetical protein